MWVYRGGDGSAEGKRKSVLMVGAKQKERWFNEVGEGWEWGWTNAEVLSRTLGFITAYTVGTDVTPAENGTKQVPGAECGPYHNRPPWAFGSQLRAWTRWVCDVRNSPIDRSHAPLMAPDPEFHRSGFPHGPAATPTVMSYGVPS
jgi:hypothetical protein